MKQFLFSIIAFVFAFPALATVDAHDKVYVVVQNIQEPEEFFVERVPVVGCYGAPQGPQLEQFTSEYKVSSNIGCGGEKFLDNINYLTCAKIVDVKKSSDFMTVTGLTLDVSKCEAKNNSKFLSTVKTAAKLNFPVKNGEVQLNLLK